MKLNLTRPIIIFDLETTGLDIAKDRIIQISYIKVMPDGKEIRNNIFINPGISIPEPVVELTHITDDMVKDAPKFKDVAADICKDFEGCDYAGFNSNRFDIPFLVEEMLRAGVPFDISKSRLIDVQTIFHKMERRNLAAAYKFYCGRSMEDDFQAHLADQDTEATYRVLMGQLDMYSPDNQEEEERRLTNDMDSLAEFCKVNDNVDFAGRIVWGPVKGPDGKPLLDNMGNPRKQEYFNFGKYKGWVVAEVIRRDPGFINWMMTSDFPRETLQCLTRIRMREIRK